jgi:hypothetical protein
MEREFKITIELRVTAEGDDEESLQEAVKFALRQAIELDEAGEQPINFEAEETEEF